MNKVLLVALFSILFLPFLVSAQEQQSSGPYKWNSCVRLTQICANCTYVNITSVIIPVNGTNVLLNLPTIAMTRNDTVYNGTFCGTSNLGKHIANWKANPSGVNEVGNWDFDITTTGLEIPMTVLFFIVGLTYLVVILGVYKRDITITLLGTFMLYFTGLFLLIFGLNIYKNWLTDSFSFITLGIAGYLSVVMAHEYIL